MINQLQTCQTSRVYPEFKDKYYVYALCRPNGIPFYIGKGIGARINNHFKPSSLVGNSPKIARIKKYGIRVRRCILAYFDEEESAYQLEEDLIKVYGLINEGGVLTNYAKTRFQYSKSFSNNVASLGHINRKRVYSDNLIISAFKMYFNDGLPVRVIEKELGIPSSYISSCVTGRKHSKLLFKCFNDGLINNSFPIDKAIYRTPKKSKHSSEVVFECYDKWLSGNYTLSELSKMYNVSVGHLTSIFKGRKRKDLIVTPLNPKFKKKGVSLDLAKRILNNRYLLSMSYGEIVLATGVPKTTVSRICSLSGSYSFFENYVSGLSKGSGNGTSDKVSEDDKSASNLSNK